MTILKEKITQYRVTERGTVKGYDVGEIVRCKDCEFYPNKAMDFCDDSQLVCNSYPWCYTFEPEGYCHKAKRSE